MGARKGGKSCAKLGLKLRLPIKRSVPLQPPGYLLLVLHTTLPHATVLKGSQLATSTKVFTPLFTTFESLGLIESSKVFKGRNSHFSKCWSALKLIGAHPPLNQWFWHGSGWYENCTRNVIETLVHFSWVSGAIGEMCAVRTKVSALQHNVLSLFVLNIFDSHFLLLTSTKQLLSELRKNFFFSLLSMYLRDYSSLFKNEIHDHLR